MYTNLQSKVCVQFCFQVRRPLISTIADVIVLLYVYYYISTIICHFMRNEKSLPKYEKFKMSAFLIYEKAAAKMDKFFNFLSHIQKAAILISQS